MRAIERFLQQIYSHRRAQIKDQWRCTVTCSAAGSLYTASPIPSSTERLQIVRILGHSYHGQMAPIIFYTSEGTSPTNVVGYVTTYSGTPISNLNQGDPGSILPPGQSLVAGFTGASGPVLVCVYGYTI